MNDALQLSMHWMDWLNLFLHFLLLSLLSIGGAITTAGGLTFIAATIDRTFRAFETRTGRELWQAALPAAGKATPMTYRANGRQFIVIAAGGDGAEFGTGDAIMAFALPDSSP